MLVVFGLTAFGVYLAHQSVAADARRDLQQDFQAQLSSLHVVQNLQHTALLERCRLLVANPRLHAALEDNALDLLYPSARDELRELIEGGADSDQPNRIVRVRFYRFLDPNGTVLPGADSAVAGALSKEAEAQLSLKSLPSTPQTGYLPQESDGEDGTVNEVMAIPIFSTEGGELISALVVGFKPLQMPTGIGKARMKSGLWAGDSLSLPTLSSSGQSTIRAALASAITASRQSEGNFKSVVEGKPHFLFFKRLNPDSLFPPGYEICAYPLAEYEARQRKLVWQVGAAGGALLLTGLIASQLIAQRLAAPVEQLAVDSKQNQMERRRAEAALEMTSEELERTARYSADASHQLKSPVTVLRAGLESLLGQPDFKPEVYEELSTLLHQTYRLTGTIDDLLLLARMDAGHVKIGETPVNLTALVEEWLDDLSAMPESIDLRTEKEVPKNVYIAGERRYTSLIVQNLLENARKYNRPAGLIKIGTRIEDDAVTLSVGNTGVGIAEDARAHIFERFHRGSSSERVAGHGLGLNLARELARLHGGDLRLVRAAEDWTEFEVRFRAARNGQLPAAQTG
jgi:signal transduction histidine kinase